MVESDGAVTGGLVTHSGVDVSEILSFGRGGDVKVEREGVAPGGGEPGFCPRMKVLVAVAADRIEEILERRVAVGVGAEIVSQTLEEGI